MFPVLYLLGILDMVFKFFPEVAYRAGYWPGCCVTERADRIAFNIFCHVDKQVDVVHVTVTVLDPVKHFLHPAGSLAAGTALSAGFVVIEPRERPEISYDTGGFIHDDEAPPEPSMVPVWNPPSASDS